MNIAGDAAPLLIFFKAKGSTSPSMVARALLYHTARYRAVQCLRPDLGFGIPFKVPTPGISPRRASDG